MRTCAVLFLLLSSGALGSELKFEKDSGVIIWRCGQVAMAVEIGRRTHDPISTQLPDYCLSIGKALGVLTENGEGK